MGVRGKKRQTSARGFGSDERGQSVLEFLLLLPLMVGLVIILLRVNTAIQVSIVNQQYSRAYLLFVAKNSPYYPPKFLRDRSVARGTLDNQLVMGVADQAIGPDNPQPNATIQYVARRPGQGSDDPQSEPDQRAKVRVRNTVTVCAQNWTLRKSSNSMTPVLPVDGAYLLDEGTKFDYCGGILRYE